VNLRGQRPWKNPEFLAARTSHGLICKMQQLLRMQSLRLSLWNIFAAMLACEGRAIAAGTIKNGAPER
jgi:hypothetical protein